jgi:hypothetical protein
MAVPRATSRSVDGGGEPSPPVTALGLPSLRARTGALLALADTLPPVILFDLLGISEDNASRWARLAAGDWNRYAAHRSGPAGV